jgi:hypothetical protein
MSTPNPTESEPTEEVVESPVGVSERLVVGDNDPTEDVVESPVNEIISVRLGEIDPTDDVADTPVSDTSRDDSPQFSKPQESDPQPAKFSTVIESELVAVVVETPVSVKLTFDKSPHSFSPKFLAPQPVFKRVAPPH